MLFKKDAIIKLEENLNSNRLLINEIVRHIENSLTENLWVGASRLAFLENCKITESDFERLNLEDNFNSPNKAGQKIKCLLRNSGPKVFYEEYLAVKLMDNFVTKSKIFAPLRPLFEETVAKLVKADKLLALTAIYDAEFVREQNPDSPKSVALLIIKAKNELTQAEVEAQKQRSGGAIVRLAISWLRAQLAIKFTSLK